MTRAQKKAQLAQAQVKLAIALAAQEKENTFENACAVMDAQYWVDQFSV